MIIATNATNRKTLNNVLIVLSLYRNNLTLPIVAGSVEACNRCRGIVF